MGNVRHWGVAGSACAVLVSIVGAGCSLRTAATAVADADAGVTTASLEVDEATANDFDCDRDDKPSVCTFTKQGTLETHHVEVSSKGKGGCATYVADIVTDTSSPDNETPKLHLDARTRINGSLVAHYTVSQAPGQPTQATVHWGPKVRGARDGSFTFDQNLISGSIDGRAFSPFPPSANPSMVTFVDGRPDPDLRSSDATRDAVARLEPLIKPALASCPTTPVPALLVTSNTDHGHLSDTYSAGQCIACQGLCTGGFAAAIAACCIFSVGTACAACVIGAGIVGTTCDALCLGTSFCCPVSCGSGVGGPCCKAGESCVSPANGLCCGTTQTQCDGVCCDNATETCLGNGHGDCCKNTNLCGGNCCTQPQDCINGSQCCSLETGNQICGTPGGTQNCCGPLETCMPDGTCCATGIVSGGVCCPANTSPCGGGSCCNPGQTCTAQGTCAGCPTGEVGCPNSPGLCCGNMVSCCGNICCGAGTECCTLLGDTGPTCHQQGVCSH